MTIERPCTDPECWQRRTLGYVPHPWHDLRAEMHAALAGGQQNLAQPNAWVDVLNDEARCAQESYDKHLTFALDARLPTSVAGRMEVIAAWLEGFPVLSESLRRNRP